MFTMSVTLESAFENVCLPLASCRCWRIRPAKEKSDLRLHRDVSDALAPLKAGQIHGYM
jgi:hypothetical protein